MTLEDLRLLYDWSLPGRRLYGLSPADRFYIVAKVDVETDEPVYPCRPSEHRGVTEEAEEEVYRVKQEIVDTVTQRLNVEEREAWRRNEEFWAALRDHQPLEAIP